MLIWGRAPLLRASFEVEQGDLHVGWRPDLDVFELPQEFVLSLSLPGVRPEDVDVTVQDRIVTVSGERSAGIPDQAVAHLIESARGRFARRVRMPANTDVAGMRVRMADGQLLVHVPKAPPRSMSVTVTRVR
jgi:HSP20 family protein